MQSVATIAPAAGLLLTFPFTASYAGVATPLALLVAFVVMAFVAYGLAQLAPDLPSAGGYYTYVSRTIGARAGFLAAWLVLIYVMSAGMNAAFLGQILHGELSAKLSIDVPWWVFLVLAIVFLAVFLRRGVSLSGRALLYLGAFELAVLLILGIWGLADPGSGGASLAPFNPANAPSGSGLYLGVVFSVSIFVGWEGAAPMAEETRDPRRSIPRVFIGSVLLVGLIGTIAGWGVVTGWGTDHMASFVSSTRNPAIVLANHLWGVGYLVVLLALLNSVLGVGLAGALVSTRTLFALGRSGILPSWFAKTHPKFQTPWNASMVIVALTIALGFGLGFAMGPANAFGFYALALTLGLVVIYVMGNIAVFRWFWKERRARFNVVKHVIIPAVSSAAVVWIGYKSVIPLPSGLAGKGVWLFVGWLALGVVVLIVSRLRGQEEWLSRAGAAAAVEEEAESLSE
jgi:amino acid transporter